MGSVVLIILQERVDPEDHYGHDLGKRRVGPFSGRSEEHRHE